MKKIFTFILITLISFNVYAADNLDAANKAYGNSNFKEAFRIYKLQAQKNNPIAQYMLGKMYLNGDFVKRDYATAVFYYRMAANNKVFEAMKEIAPILYYGVGVDKNIEEGIKWFAEAAKYNDAFSQYKLGEIYFNGFNGVQANKEEGLKLYKQSAEQNFVLALHDLGLIYASGSYVEKDNNEAFKYFKRAAELKYKESQFVVGKLYAEGLGTIQSKTEAFKWIKLAAEQGYSDAQYEVGFMYEEGLGTDKDLSNAAYWYKQAAEQGQNKAFNNLGRMYMQGQGVVQDFVKAHMWFNLSASKGTEVGIKNRDMLAKSLTQQQLTEAQKLASDCEARKYKGC